MLLFLMFIDAGPQVIQTLSKSDDVRGVTLLNNELYVLRDRQNDQVDVYSTADFTLLSHLSIQGVSGRDTRDIASCVLKQCIYISDNGMICIHRVGLDSSVSKWPVNGSPRGLSVMRSSNLLVTCGDWRGKDGKLLELSSDSGVCLREVQLEQDIEWPWHAVLLDNGLPPVLSYGTRANNSGLSHIGDDGRVRLTRNIMDGGLECPSHMAVDDNEFVFVANAKKKDISLFDSSLIFVRYVTRHKQHEPQRLCFDDVTRRLYVGQSGGVVIVVQL